MVRVKGIEPFSSAWKAEAQPVYQTRLIGSQEFVINALEKAKGCPAKNFSLTRLNGGE